MVVTCQDAISSLVLVGAGNADSGANTSRHDLQQ